LALLSFAPNIGTLIAAFVVFGVGTGLMDVSMNANGVAVEKLQPKPIMSSLHGMFSLGGLSFAGIGWLVVKLGASVQAHFVGAAALFALALTLIYPRLLPTVADPDHVPPPFALPERSVLVVGLIAFCAFLSEGAMGDWSAVYMRKALHQTPATSTLGYFGFALAMTVTRFGGDAILHRWGPSSTLRVCGSVTAVGLGAALWFGFPWLTVIGFTTVGLGMATVAPIAFSLGGRIGGDRPDHAISSVATMGYMAFVIGPAFIGFVARSWSLRDALAIVVVLALAIVALAGFAGAKS
jgi:MFS family permease